jgi:hypothetical protein
VPDEPVKPPPDGLVARAAKRDGDIHARPTPPAFPRPLSPTLTDPAELEEARQRSVERASGPSFGRGSMLSLVNARAPSVVPAAPGVAGDAASEVDDAWDAHGSAAAADAHAAGAPGSACPTSDAEDGTRAPALPADDMAERLALGDYTGALAVADDILAREPDHTAAAATADTCRAVLRKMYAARIGPLDRVPNVTVARDQMRWLSIDHRAGFVLSLVDGVSTVEMILDVSGMPTLDALRILSELVQQRIITFR